MKQKGYSIIYRRNKNYLNYQITTLLLMLAAFRAAICLGVATNSNFNHSAIIAINRMATATQQPQATSVNGSIALQQRRNQTTNSSEQFIVNGPCAGTFASCKSQQQQLQLKKGLNCNCDQKCNFYGDCCPFDNPYANNITIKTMNNERNRKLWHCHRVNSVFGDVLMKASCPIDWLSSNKDNLAARLTQKRCEFAARQQEIRQTNNNDLDLQTDPIGMMMPITDLTSGITYANSHCLRCNSKLILTSQQKETSKQVTSQKQTSVKGSKLAKLIYWSPLLECNYNLDTDDRNTLYDLISTNKGQALHYSIRKKKWLINMEGVSNNQNKSAEHQHQPNNADTFERVCSITPTVPESVEHSAIRYCQLNAIDQCKQLDKVKSESTEYLKAKQECEYGNQALVYTETNVYFNPGCAKCNFERKVSCQPLPPSRVKFPPTGPAVYRIKTVEINQPNKPEVLHSPISIYGGEPLPDIPSTGGDQPHVVDSLAGFGRSSAGTVIQPPGAPISGSFSVLMDLYGSSQGDEQVGAVHQCPDTENQVYDPFFLTCRDIVCGLNHQLVDGKICMPVGHDKTENLTHANLVEKFKAPMVYLTAVGLIISITSLLIYLILYCLSMFDLRYMVVEMAQAGQRTQLPNNPLDKVRGSRESGCAEASSSWRGAQLGTRSQSLASRGVACLASSLLAAYLLFILGHQNNTANETTNEISEEHSGDITNTIEKPTLTCFILAVATYYCFLVSFNWMFLLSYDVWRTLRLATCHLRAPSLNSQSTRFIIYSIYALLTAGLVVVTAILVDKAPPGLCSPILPPPENFLDCSSFDRNELSYFLHNYRPKFGQRMNSCWFSNRRALALFFGLPVTLIMILNLIFFLHSSFMVIKTSSKSSLKQSSSSSANYEPKTPDTQIKGFTFKCNNNNNNSNSNQDANCNNLQIGGDFTHQNGLTTSSLSSVQTIQSNLSASSTTSSTSSSYEFTSTNGPDSPSNVRQEQQDSQEDQSAAKKSPPPLVASQSSSSLTNQSVGGVSISTSLAMKYDAHMHNLSSLMNSIVKDYRLYCRLSTIMGLTWLTGLVASIVDQSDVLWYLFVVLNTLQGLFIFIAFGCKRSKLTNVEILISYMHFKWKQLRFCSLAAELPKQNSPENK